MTAADNLMDAAKKHPIYLPIKKINGKIVIGKGQMANPEYLFIGEAPGQDETVAGKPFVGRSGKILDEWIEKAGIKNYAVINAVPVMPTNQDGSIRTPTPDEIAYFRPYTRALIEEIKPNRIICVGKSAAKFLELDKQFRNKTWAGEIGFIYHPSYYLRNGVRGTDDFLELIQKITGAPHIHQGQTGLPKRSEPEKKQKSLGEYA